MVFPSKPTINYTDTQISPRTAANGRLITLLDKRLAPRNPNSNRPTTCTTDSYGGARLTAIILINLDLRHKTNRSIKAFSWPHLPALAWASTFLAVPPKQLQYFSPQLLEHHESKKATIFASHSLASGEQTGHRPSLRFLLHLHSPGSQATDSGSRQPVRRE